MAEQNIEQNDGNATASTTEQKLEPIASNTSQTAESEPTPAEMSKPEPAKPESPRIEAPHIEAKAPPAAKSSPIIPPQFLKDHATRRVGAKPGDRTVAAEKVRNGRFALLATSIASAACVGSLIGSLAVALFAYILSGGAGATTSAQRESAAEIKAIREIVGQLGTELAVMKTSIEQSAKIATAQAGKIADRLERAERLQAEPTAKLAKLIESLDRIERKAAPAPAPAPATQASAAPPAAAAQGDITGTVSHSASPKPVIVEGWFVRKVSNGVAIVEGPRGVGEVEPGDRVPGVGKVEEIRRQEGRWVVVTNKGLILARPDR